METVKPPNTGPYRIKGFISLPQAVRTLRRVCAALLGLMQAACGALAPQVPPTVLHDANLGRIAIGGAQLHVETHGAGGARPRPTLVVVHGGPGGDFSNLRGLSALSSEFQVVFYDQRGTGLSERRPRQELTLEQNLEDLKGVVLHYGQGQPVRLVGHSWGAMLAIAFAARHPQWATHVVAVEPGMLNPQAAQAFVATWRQRRSWLDALPMLGDVMASLGVPSRDGHERFDSVMTAALRRGSRGGLDQCPGERRPEPELRRAGYEAFSAMLRPILSDPSRFHWDLTQGLQAYRGKLLLVGSSCSTIGYDFQRHHHRPHLPEHTQFVLAPHMGHNLLSTHPEWSLSMLRAFLLEHSVH
jgi:proline iminopeptidase